jgi:chromosome segregation and condensation protein ScpB
MSRTTIEITQERKEQLRDARKPHESNYDETIARLLGNNQGGQLWTEAEIKELATQAFEEQLHKQNLSR